MDSLIAAAARALAAGDTLAGLTHVALREDPPALALRGIAMAQLGEHARARELLRRAARGFGPREALSRARCVVAEAEVALAMRDLRGSPRALAAAATTLEIRADHANALQARLIGVRRSLLLGRLVEARTMLASLDLRGVPPSLAAVADMALAEVALRSLRTAEARKALDRAAAAAQAARIPALLAEVAEARLALTRPAARRIDAGHEVLLRLDEVEGLLDSDVMVVDACRRMLRLGDISRPLLRRPILFTLARCLAQAWPGDVDRGELITRAFRIRRADESHRARLRVEIGRLRALVAPMARIEASERGFALRPLGDRRAVLLLPPFEGEQASLLALLADGAPWSTSALALATGASQRTVQRALGQMQATRRVRSIGDGRARRWLAPALSGFTTILLLPASLPPG